MVWRSQAGVPKRGPDRSPHRLDRSRIVIDVTERSPDEKAHALEVYEQHGLATAHRQTGIPKPTLHAWAVAAGLNVTQIAGEHAQRTMAATHARVARCDAMREELRERMLETAGTLLDRVDLPHVEYRGQHAVMVTYPVPPGSTCRDYVWAMAVLVDKYRLEVGEVTDRSELIGADTAQAKERLAKIIDLASERRAS